MNYRLCFLHAFHITWQNKYLWVLGFCAGLSLGSINYNLYSYNFIQGSSWLFQNLRHILNTQVSFAVFLLLVSVFIWVIGILARIGLVIQVSSLDSGSDSSYAGIRSLIHESTTYFLPILGMELVIWSPVILVSLLYIGSAQFISGEISFFILLVFGSILYLLPILLLFIDTFAFRTLISKKTSVKSSIKYSLVFLKKNVKDILFLTIICLLFGFIYLAIADLILTPILDALMTSTKAIAPHCVGSDGLYFELTNCLLNTISNLGVIPLLIVISVLVAIFTSIWITFQSTVFTIAYNELAPAELSLI